MYNTDEYCPNCITELKPITKRFGPQGGKRVFLQCPGCGYNIMKSSKEFHDRKDMDDLKEMKLILNNSFTNQYKENGESNPRILRCGINRPE